MSGCSFNKWYMVLTHELIRYNRHQFAREAKRGGGNIHRLSRLLGAAQRSRDESGGSVEGLRSALERNFTFDPDRRTGKLEPPSMLRRFMRQLDAGDCEPRP